MVESERLTAIALVLRRLEEGLTEFRQDLLSEAAGLTEFRQDLLSEAAGRTIRQLRADLASDDDDVNYRARHLLGLTTHCKAVIALNGSRPACAAHGCQFDVKDRA